MEWYWILIITLYSLLMFCLILTFAILLGKYLKILPRKIARTLAEMKKEYDDQLKNKG